MNARDLCRRLPAALLSLAALFLATSAHAEGALSARDAQGRALGNFPLVRTTLRAEVSGEVASVTVEQRFHNSFSERIEAVYVFPLPNDAAVDEMEMHLGARTVRARIARRADAREHYETARNHGQTAALLEQDRPNLFTFNVANIAPGGDIDVRVRFFATARYELGTHTLALPMVVGPRYVPDGVSDASRIATAYVPPLSRSGHAVSVNVRLTANGPIERIETPLHDSVVRPLTDAVSEISLRDKDEIPNRDFVLRWRVRAPALVASLLAHRPDASRDGYFSLTLEPRHDAPLEEIAAREIFFLLDTSGSMFGPPLDAVKTAVRRALSSMSPGDSFQIVDFADTASTFAPRPLAATPENVARGVAYLDALQASGGTSQLAGIHAALSAPGDSMRLRYVVFMTDGYIGNESEVIALTRHELGAARVFSFGVGASVNRYLLDEVALAGRGSAEYLLPAEAPDAAIERFYQRIARPYLTDVSVEFRGVTVSALSPRELPDVSALSPLALYGRYHTPGSGRAVVRGSIAGHAFAREITVEFPSAEPAHEAISRLWARNAIASLSREMHFDATLAPAHTEEITALALGHHLLSPFTSLVAVDETTPIDAHGAPMRVDQPAEAPLGVSLPHAGGEVANNTAPPPRAAYSTAQDIGTLMPESTPTRPPPARAYSAGNLDDLLNRVPGGTPSAPSPAPAASDVPALSAASVRRVIGQNSARIDRCYSQARMRLPTLAGLLLVRFVIGPDGRVSAATVATSTLAPGDAQLAQCVTGVVHQWRFDPPSGGRPATITYPFRFTAP